MRMAKAPAPISQAGRPFVIRGNLAVIVRGPLDALQAFAEKVEELAPTLGLVIVHKAASGYRLWVKEGGEGENHDL